MAPGGHGGRLVLKTTGEHLRGELVFGRHVAFEPHALRLLAKMPEYAISRGWGKLICREQHGHGHFAIHPKRQLLVYRPMAMNVSHIWLTWQPSIDVYWQL